MDPNVTRGAWSAEEDVALRDLYNRLGPKWSLICRSVPGRTAQQCRARWFQIDGSTTSERTGEESRSERANGRFSDHEGLAVPPPMASLSPTPGAPAFRQILAEVSARTSAPSVGRVDAHHQHAQTRTPVRASTAMDPMSLWRDASSATPTERVNARATTTGTKSNRDLTLKLPTRPHLQPRRRMGNVEARAINCPFCSASPSAEARANDAESKEKKFRDGEAIVKVSSRKFDDNARRKTRRCKMT